MDYCRSQTGKQLSERNMFKYCVSVRAMSCELLTQLVFILSARCVLYICTYARYVAWHLHFRACARKLSIYSKVDILYIGTRLEFDLHDFDEKFICYADDEMMSPPLSSSPTWMTKSGNSKWSTANTGRIYNISSYVYICTCDAAHSSSMILHNIFDIISNFNILSGQLQVVARPKPTTQHHHHSRTLKTPSPPPPPLARTIAIMDCITAKTSTRMHAQYYVCRVVVVVADILPRRQKASSAMGRSHSRPSSKPSARWRASPSSSIYAQRIGMEWHHPNAGWLAETRLCAMTHVSDHRHHTHTHTHTARSPPTPTVLCLCPIRAPHGFS